MRAFFLAIIFFSLFALRDVYAEKYCTPFKGKEICLLYNHDGARVDIPKQNGCGGINLNCSGEGGSSYKFGEELSNIKLKKDNAFLKEKSMIMEKSISPSTPLK